MSETLVAAVSFHEEIRKSRFLALAEPVTSAEAAADALQRLCDPGATHNCWAWKIGQQYRFNDDGEPGGTAGRPILAAIEGQGLDHVLVLVIRWYGGIKLGTGGLARAYGGSAAKCLQSAPRQALVRRVERTFSCGYAELAPIKARLDGFAARIEDEAFGAEGVALCVAIAEEQLSAFAAWLADFSRGRIQLDTEG